METLQKSRAKRDLRALEATTIIRKRTRHDFKVEIKLLTDRLELYDKIDNVLWLVPIEDIIDQFTTHTLTRHEYTEP